VRSNEERSQPNASLCDEPIPLTHRFAPRLFARRRIAKGRHFPGDVVVGAIVGAVVGWFVEDYLDGLGRSVVKMIGGIFITYQYGVTFLIPEVSGDENAGAISKYGVAYYGFYVLLFFATLPKDFETMGAQTLGVDGSTCTTIF